MKQKHTHCHHLVHHFTLHGVQYTPKDVCEARYEMCDAQFEEKCAMYTNSTVYSDIVKCACFLDCAHPKLFGCAFTPL